MLSAGADEIPGAHRVRRDLFRLGFAVEGGLFTAAEVGFPHERARLFILGVADTDQPEFRRQPSAGQFSEHEPHARFGLGPPGPSDRDAWSAILAERPDLAPAVAGLRRVADGLDYTRIDELRLLGNGVVPLVAAYAVRTLASRLSARGSPGADELVRLMEQEG